MPTPIRSELRSLRHSRNSDVVFQEDAKNFGLFIQKRSNSERKDTKKSANRFKCLPILYNFKRNTTKVLACTIHSEYNL